MKTRRSQQKLARIQLVARVQVAYEQLLGAAGPAREAARRRLFVLNRALALLALQTV